MDEKTRYQLTFSDAAGAAYQLSVTDLTFRRYCDAGCAASAGAEAEFSARLERMLQAGDLFLRIGLARGWDRHPDRCHLQITGVYTFPDYLDGHSFADFK